MVNGRCGDCHFYDKSKQVCNNPSRDDSKNIFFYGHIKPDDYCTLFESRESKYATGGLYTGPKGVIV